MSEIWIQRVTTKFNEKYFASLWNLVSLDQADEAKGLTNTNSLDTVRQIGCLPQN